VDRYAPRTGVASRRIPVSVTVAWDCTRNHVYGMTDDAFGPLWLSSGKRCVHGAKNDLIEYGRGTKDRVTWWCTARDGCQAPALRAESQSRDHHNG